MATLLLLGLWMFLSLTLVKEQDLGRKLRRPAAAGREGGRGGGLQHQQLKNGEGEGVLANGEEVGGAGGNGGVRRASLTRKEVSNEGGREKGMEGGTVRQSKSAHWLPHLGISHTQLFTPPPFRPFVMSFPPRQVTVGVVQEVVDMLFFLAFLPLIWLMRQWVF